MKAYPLCIAALAAFAADAADSFTIAQRGERSSCAVVVATNADECVKYAASELQKYTKQMTGVELPIFDEAAQPPPVKAVVLDVSTHERRAGDSAPYHADAFRLCASNGNLRITGASSRGVLYGVYDLLERFGGCDWFAPWCEKVPERTTFEVPSNLDFADSPAFDARYASWRHVHTRRDRASRDFAAKMRFNSSAEARYGGSAVKYAKGLAWDNAIGRIIPPKDYFKMHPEWYSEINGRRVDNDWQPCCMNKELAAFVAERVKEYFRAEPDADACSIAQMDNGRPCQCAACKVCAKEEGSMSGPNILFANAVADEVGKEFPGKLITTFAYKHTRHAPRHIRPRDNVMVVFCSYECSFAGPFENAHHKNTARFCDDLRAWGRICRNIRLYDYCTNFRNYLFPFPNITGLAPNYRLFRDCGTRWLGSQGGGDGFHAEFAELKCYLQSKLMWNPDQEVEPLVDRFLKGYYGDAAPFVKDYIGRIYGRFGLSTGNDDPDPDAEPAWAGIYAENVPLSETFIDEALAIWKKAEEAVKNDPVALYNVRTGELPLLYVRLKRLYEENWKSVWIAKDTSRFADGMARMRACTMDFLSLMDEAAAHKRVVSLSEGSGVRHKSLMAAFRQVSSGVAIPETASNRVEISTNHCDMAYSKHFRAWRLPIRCLAVDDGAKYRVRVHLRPKAVASGNADGVGFVAGLDVEWLSRAKGTALKKFAPKDVSSDWAWYDVGECDFSALQKIPRPTMNGLCLVVKGDVEFDRMELIYATE